MSTPTHEPTPEEIAAATAAYRATWSEREHYVRAGQKVPPQLLLKTDSQHGNADGWTAPEVRIGALG